jgi:RHS repeat-associated protein
VYCVRLRSLVCVPLLLSLFASIPLSGGVITSNELHIQGVSFTVEEGPIQLDSQVAGRVQTFVNGRTGDEAPSLDGAVVRGELTGPGLLEAIELQTVPGYPFTIPALSELGVYHLQNIRLVRNGELLRRATPSLVTIEVFNALQSRIEVRQLTPEELRQRGITLDPRNYEFYGILWEEELPTGAIVRRAYDERGTLRQYIDELGRVTHYDSDAIGRVWRIRYPDQTHEEMRFEDGTGALLASRNRAGEWIWFEYGDGGRLAAEHHGGSGNEPSLTANPFIRYAYDLGGRVVRVASADAAIEYGEYDLLGRPGITRTIRYSKTGCIPAAVACGSGLTANPQAAEVYTQAHVWSAIDDDRDRWRMPVVGASVGETESSSPWRQWIVEARDGGMNLVELRTSAGRSAPVSATPITLSKGRGPGRLAERERSVSGPVGILLTRFGYSDRVDPGSTPAVPVTAPVAGHPTGALARAEVLAAGRTIAGSEIAFGAKRLIEQHRDLGLSSRESEYLYDERSRLERSVLLRQRESGGIEPAVEEGLSAAGLRERRTIDPQRFTLGEVMTLIAAGQTPAMPMSWAASAITDSHQMLERLIGNLPEATQQEYTWSGGRRTDDGEWTASYDRRNRLVAQESSDRRITYDYDPQDRVIGRTAWQKNAAGEWTLETRTNVLARDALPAAATFVWDPLVDRLVAVFDGAQVAQAIASGATLDPATGLVRQIVHGDQGYDDPVEVLIASAPGSSPQRFLPIFDEAGNRSLQAIADTNGYLVERVLYADSYGDAPRYLQGALVERIASKREGEAQKITIYFSEAVDAATLGTGLRLRALAADGLPLRTSAVVPAPLSDHHTEWSIGSAAWAVFIDGAASIEVSVSDALRFHAWGDRPLQRTAEWEEILGRASATAGFPFVQNVAISQFAHDATHYDLPDLYLSGRTESVVKLHIEFHALPLRDPATGLIYARARWYDPSTGSFVTPDPMGYEDASSLYAYAGNDPVNFMDPSGLFGIRDTWKLGVGFADGIGHGLGALARGVVDAAAFGYNASGAAAYAVTGWEGNRAQSEAFHQTVSSIKTVLDNPGIIIEAVVSAASDTITAFREGDYETVGRAAGMIGFEIATAFGTGGGSAALKSTKLLRAADAAGDIARTVRRIDRAEDLAGLTNDVRRAQRSLTPDPPTSSLGGPCALRPVLSCVGEGTLIATPYDSRPIEELRVGDRVAATNINPDFPDGSTTVDEINWHLLKLRMANPADPEDIYEIRTLRPIEWIVAHDAFPGRLIEFETERSPADKAYVISVDRAPPVQKGTGRVVLSTFTHRDRIVALSLEGSDESLHTTRTHRLYSVDRGTWVEVASLRPGEQVRTAKGAARIVRISEREVSRVFDIEVEEDHSYYHAEARVLSHNCGGGVRDSKGRLRDSRGRFAPDGGPVRRSATDGVHRNTARSDVDATLYAKYDAEGSFEKWGITFHENPRHRYSAEEIAEGMVARMRRGPRTEMLQKERRLVERAPGTDNFEPWAGRRKPGHPNYRSRGKK